jgi:similar to stage IV sporulation protein
MRSELISRCKGYVIMEVRGKRMEQLLNTLTGKQIPVWNIRRNEESLILNIHVRDFFRLRPFLKQTGCRVRVKKRVGFPFILDKLERRKFFMSGIACFIVGLYLLSSLVWQIDVTGNENIPEEEVLKAAENIGVYPLQWKFRLQDPDILSKQLTTNLPGTSWVGVEIKGTRVNIRVVESTIPEKRELFSPRHLISAHDAVVTNILAEKGMPLVEVNQRVRKGDILISGTIGEGETVQTVVAKGKVRGLVWHEYDITVPLIHKFKTYTGNQKDRLYIVFGNRALQITGYGKTGYVKYETNSSRHTFQWNDIILPFGWIKETELEVRFVEQPMDKEDAQEVGLQQARADILLKAGTDAHIKEEKILQVDSEHGKVYMKVLFEVEQDIVAEQPIIQGD